MMRPHVTAIATRTALCAAFAATAACSSSSAGSETTDASGDTATMPEGGASLESGADAVTETGATPPACKVAGSVADPLAISGTIMLSGAGPASGATVDLLKDSDDSVLATATTAADGTYSLPGVASGGSPLPAHWRITLTGYLTTLVYVVDGPHTKLMNSTLFTSTAEDAYSGSTWNHADGIVHVLVFACNAGKGIAGATIAVVPGSKTTYTDGNGNLAVNATSTSLPQSDGFDFAVPPGAAAVSLTTGGATTTVSVKSLAGGLTYLIDSP